MEAILKPKYNIAVDVIRIISIVSVIIIHTTTKILEFTKYDLINNQFILYLNQASRFAVPLFFLISAFVLELNYSETTNFLIYFKKRFSKIVLPYIFWSLIYYFIVYPGHSESFLNDLLLGHASYQLYFIPALFIFYLIFPILHHFIKFLSKKIIVFVLFIVQILLLTNDYYYSPLALPHPIGVFILNFDVLILGMLASHHCQKVLDVANKYKYILTFITILISIIIFTEGEKLYFQSNNYLFFYSNWRPLVFVYTLLFASLMYLIFNRLNFNVQLIKKISSFSFFVFFIHVIFIEIVYRNLPHWLLLSFPITFLSVLILSYLSAFIVSKIPQLSKITG